MYFFQCGRVVFKNFFSVFCTWWELDGLLGQYSNEIQMFLACRPILKLPPADISKRLLWWQHSLTFLPSSIWGEKPSSRQGQQQQESAGINPSFQFSLLLRQSQGKQAPAGRSPPSNPHSFTASTYLRLCWRSVLLFQHAVIPLHCTAQPLEYLFMQGFSNPENVPKYGTIPVPSGPVRDTATILGSKSHWFLFLAVISSFKGSVLLLNATNSNARNI